MRAWKDDPFLEWRAAKNMGRHVPRRGIFRQAGARWIFFNITKPVRNFIFMAKIDVSLKFSQIPGGQQYAFAGSDAPARLSHKRGDVAVVARGSLRLHRARFKLLARHGEALQFQSRMARKERVPIAGNQ